MSNFDLLQTASEGPSSLMPLPEVSWLASLKLAPTERSDAPIRLSADSENQLEKGHLGGLGFLAALENNKCPLLPEQWNRALLLLVPDSHGAP